MRVCFTRPLFRRWREITPHYRLQAKFVGWRLFRLKNLECSIFPVVYRLCINTRRNGWSFDIFIAAKAAR
jgi:hypothetical protein